MKVEILYYELKRKEFRSEKTLRSFLNKKLTNQILRVIEFDKGNKFLLEIRSFINKYRG